MAPAVDHHPPDLLQGLPGTGPLVHGEIVFFHIIRHRQLFARAAPPPPAPAFALLHGDHPGPGGHGDCGRKQPAGQMPRIDIPGDSVIEGFGLGFGQGDRGDSFMLGRIQAAYTARRPLTAGGTRKSPWMRRTNISTVTAIPMNSTPMGSASGGAALFRMAPWVCFQPPVTSIAVWTSAAPMISWDTPGEDPGGGDPLCGKPRHLRPGQPELFRLPGLRAGFMPHPGPSPKGPQAPPTRPSGSPPSPGDAPRSIGGSSSPSWRAVRCWNSGTGNCLSAVWSSIPGNSTAINNPQRS